MFLLIVQYLINLFVSSKFPWKLISPLQTAVFTRHIISREMTTNSNLSVNNIGTQPSSQAAVNSLSSRTNDSTANGANFQELLSSLVMASSLTGGDSSSGAGSSLMTPILMSLLESLLTSQMDSSSTSAAPFLSSLLGTTNPYSGVANAYTGANLDSLTSLVSPSSRTPSKVISSLDESKYPITPNGAFSQAAPPEDYVPMFTSIGSGSVPDGLPVQGPLTQNFHPGHIGIDTGVPVGTPIHSTMDGKVIFAGWNTEGYGNLVIVENGDYKTYYAHQSQISVKVGQVVNQGSVIGQSGTTGNSTGPHLHYEVRVNNQAVDPADFGGMP